MPSVSKEICLEKAKRFKCIDHNDDYRDCEAYKDGGTPLNDQEVITKYRLALKMLISQIGRQLITGKFNLTNTSFPIQA